MKKFFGRKRSIVLALTAVLAITGGAIAYWSTTGSGSGTASTGTSKAVTVNQVTTPSGLYPAGPAAALPFTITNDQDYAQSVASVSASIDSVSGSCAKTNFTLSGSPVAVTTTIPKNSTTAQFPGLTLALKDTGVNQDECKNATVTIAYSAN